MSEQSRDINRAEVIGAYIDARRDRAEAPNLIVDGTELLLVDDVAAAAKLARFGVPIPGRIALEAAEMFVVPSMCSVADVNEGA